MKVRASLARLGDAGRPQTVLEGGGCCTLCPGASGVWSHQSMEPAHQRLIPVYMLIQLYWSCPCPPPKLPKGVLPLPASQLFILPTPHEHLNRCATENVSINGVPWLESQVELCAPHCTLVPCAGVTQQTLKASDYQLTLPGLPDCRGSLQAEQGPARGLCKATQGGGKDPCPTRQAHALTLILLMVWVSYDYLI